MMIINDATPDKKQDTSGLHVVVSDICLCITTNDSRNNYHYRMKTSLHHTMGHLRATLLPQPLRRGLYPLLSLSSSPPGSRASTVYRCSPATTLFPVSPPLSSANSSASLIPLRHLSRRPAPPARWCQQQSRLAWPLSREGAREECAQGLRFDPGNGRL